MLVEFPKWSEYVSPNFVTPFLFEGRYLVMYGGRGSGKSVTAARKIIYKLISENYFKGVCVRKTYNTLKDSCYETIKAEIEYLGLSELFNFKLSPLEIETIHGNKLIFRGMDDPHKIKSIKDPNFVWYEEGNELEEKDFITMTTSVRGRAEYMQEIFCFNPETGGDYKDHWIYKRFGFGDHIESSFETTTEIELEEGESITQAVHVHHSTYKDNPFLPPEFIANLEAMKKTDPYYYRVYVLGLFGNKKVGQQFYKGFEPNRNTEKTHLKAGLPVHISFDENVNPYLPAAIFQLENGQLRLIHEIAMRHPKNTVRDICNEIKHYLRGHNEPVYIYGDASSRKQDVKLEKGQNFFKIILGELEQLKPQLRVPTKNPSVAMRGRFLNEVFEKRIKDVEIVINEDSKLTIEDLLYTQETPEGTKHKEKGKDKETGVTFEKRGHFSDILDYIAIELFKDKYNSYINGGSIVPLTIGKRRLNTKHRF